MMAFETPDQASRRRLETTLGWIGAVGLALIGLTVILATLRTIAEPRISPSPAIPSPSMSSSVLEPSPTSDFPMMTKVAVLVELAQPTPTATPMPTRTPAPATPPVPYCQAANSSTTLCLWAPAPTATPKPPPICDTPVPGQVCRPKR